MNYMEEHKEFFEKLLTMLEEQYGPDNEIVLHDLTKPYDNTIIDIRNGHVTNRKIGDCGSNLGLDEKSRRRSGGLSMHQYGYYRNSPSGKSFEKL